MIDVLACMQSGELILLLPIGMLLIVFWSVMK